MKRRQFIIHDKHGMPLSLPHNREPVRATVRNYLRVVNGGKRKSKPGMPKMPWEEKK
jgi:hypothetical protein